MVTTRWYVLFRDGFGHGVRAADGFDAAIAAAGCLHRDGREIVQVGPLDKERANEVIGTGEIRHRLCVQ
jgi:hypothetical protein